jgi:hypothetical protein
MRTFITSAVRPLVAVALVAGVLLVGAAPASAKHAGETITLSKSEGLSDGETIRVTVTGFTPNAKPVKLVIAGQGTLVTIPDKLNFDEYAVAPEVPIGPDGSGSTDFVVTSDHGVVQDGSTLDCTVSQCWVVAVQEPFLPQPNYASQEIYFGAAPTTAPPVTAPPTTAPPVTAAPTTAAPTTAAPATTTTSTSTTTTTEKPDDTEKASATEEDEGGGNAALWAIIAAVVVVVAGGGFYLTRRKPAVDGPAGPSDPGAGPSDPGAGPSDPGAGPGDPGVGVGPGAGPQAT